MENIRKLLVLKKKAETADGKRKFNTYTVKMRLPIKGEEEKGDQSKWVNLKFTKHCIIAEGVDLDKIRGKFYLYTTAEEINAPYIWEIREDDKGNKKYPCVFISAVSKIEPIINLVPQNRFATDDEDVEENI